MSKKELLLAAKPRYLKASKEEKGDILNEFCANAGYARKYAIKILAAGFDHNRIARVGRKRRRKKYDSAAMQAIMLIWKTLDFPCGTRLQPMLVEMYQVLVRHKEIIVNDEIEEQLKTISSSTLDRRLKKEREIRHLKRNRGMTCRGTLLKSSIPIRITNWDTSKLGFTELDTVAHNGGDPSGQFVFTLDQTEIFSGWSEQYATMGKGERGVLNAVKTMRKDLPFPLLGMDGDNGGEIINYHMLKYCEEEKLVYTRSRPNMKNDNAYVEQKNFTHIRKLIGYHRYDTLEQLNLINDLYRNEYRLHTNFFRPVMKIQSKEKINNSVCKKTYDIAKSPYQRLMACDQISNQQKEKLRLLYFSSNPVQLKKEIDRKVLRIKATLKVRK